MITPALDLQVAPQLLDGVRSQAAPSDGAGDSGDFGAAFTASLSSSSSSAPATESTEIETAGGSRSVQRNTADVRETSAATVAARKTAVAGSGTSTGVRQPVKANALVPVNAGAEDSSVNALRNALEAAASEVAAIPDASSKGNPATQTSNKLSVPVNTEVADSEGLSKDKGAAVASSAIAAAATKVAELQALLVDASASAKTEASENSKGLSPGKENEGVARSKAIARESQPGVSGITGDLLLASLGAGAAVLPVSTVTSASTKGSAVEAVAGPGTQASFSKQNGGASVAGPSAAAAGGSSFATAWNRAAREPSSARSAVTTDSLSGTALPELASGVAIARNASSTASLSAAVAGLTSVGQTQTSPGTLFSPNGERGQAGSGEASGSLGPASVPVASASIGEEIRSGPVSSVVSSALSANLTAGTAPIAVDTLSSSAAVKPQVTSVSSLAGRSLSSAGRIGNATPGVLSSRLHGTEEGVQIGLTHAIGGAENAKTIVQADTLAGSGGNQKQVSPGAAEASPDGQASIKQAAVATERASSSHSSTAAAGTEAISQLRHGSLESTAAATDRGVTSDNNNALTVHGDSAAAVIPAHSAPAQALDLSNSAVASAANLTAAVTHQGAAGAATSGAQTAVGAVGSSTLQAAGSEALHGAGGLNGAISLQPHQTLSATPTSLEVGVHGGTQGWLKIRAEVGDQGSVTASLAATSSSGQQTLKSQLPALNAYLQSEQMSVTTSVGERLGASHFAVAHEAGSTSLSAGTGSTGQDTSLFQSDAGQSAFGQGSGQQSSGPHTVSVALESGRDEKNQSYAGPADAGGSARSSPTFDGSGRWLNVTV